MSTILSVRIDVNTKKRAETWQLDEIQHGLAELDQGRHIPNKDVANWLGSWGRKRERKAPRR
jgi:predicted transcriptional regulator